MLQEKLRKTHIVLASGSPRRKKFFEDLGLNFEIRIKEIEEIYPPDLRREQIPIFLAQQKAEVQRDALKDNELLITSDTIVWHQDRSMGKPVDLEEAKQMLQQLSGSSHEVITAVCFATNKEQTTVHNSTIVSFRELTDEEIGYYLSSCEPLDKAGAYGIQEWIGLIAIDKIEGSYYNVMGLPTHLVYETLMSMAG